MERFSRQYDLDGFVIMALTFQQRAERVNRAFNMFAETSMVDYVTGAMSAAEVMAEDKSNDILYRTRVFPELRYCGY
jgi:hypothetical protein